MLSPHQQADILATRHTTLESLRSVAQIPRRVPATGYSGGVLACAHPARMQAAGESEENSIVDPREPSS